MLPNISAGHLCHGSVIKDWRPDRFQRLQTLLQYLIYIDEASVPAEFINSPSTALNGMDIDDASAS